MIDFSSLLAGLLMFTDPYMIIILLIGVIFGVLAGAIPSFSATMAVTLALPFTFYMVELTGITLLLGVYVGGIAGGLISAILLNMPGTPSAVATTFDGYPLARKKGKPYRALKIGTLASVAGGLLGALLLIILAPNLARVALSFTRYEYFSLAVFATTTVVVLSRSELYKGLITVFLGLFFATIGSDPITGVTRLTFGFTALSGGVGIFPPLIGLFAFAQALEDVKNIDKERKSTIELNTTEERFSVIKYLATDAKKQAWSFLRSCFIGTGMGLLPGIGPATSSVVSYAQAKRASKNPEEYGEGSEEGLIAAEAANNATLGGAMVPLLALGIPGDAVTAVLLAGLMLQGLNPGPLLIRDNPEILYGILIAFFMANVLMFVVQMFTLKYFVKVVSIRTEILMPVILVFSVVGSFAMNNRFFDVWVMFFFGVLGYIFRKYNYPLLPILIGLILGPLLENNLREGLMRHGGSFLPFITRPISGTLLAISVIFTIIMIYKVPSKKEEPNE